MQEICARVCACYLSLSRVCCASMPACMHCCGCMHKAAAPRHVVSVSIASLSAPVRVPPALRPSLSAPSLIAMAKTAPPLPWISQLMYVRASSATIVGNDRYCQIAPYHARRWPSVHPTRQKTLPYQSKRWPGYRAPSGQAIKIVQACLQICQADGLVPVPRYSP